jgi:hypothetical protein
MKLVKKQARQILNTSKTIACKWSDRKICLSKFLLTPEPHVTILKQTYHKAIGESLRFAPFNLING